MVLKVAIITFLVKFLFSAVSFGSGAPGGIFFPLLILGAMVGGIFSMTGTEIFGLDPMYMNNFVLLAMAGFFTAIVRAPITGIILLFEMSGSNRFMKAFWQICCKEKKRKNSRFMRAGRKC